MEVAPNIHRIETSLGDRYACVFILTGANHTLVFDTGMNYAPEQSLQPYLHQHGIDPNGIRYVVISHSDFDHSGGGAPMRQIAPNALFLSHDLERGQVEDVELLLRQRLGEFEQDHAIADSAATKDWIRANVSNTQMDMSLSGGERFHFGRHWDIDVLLTAGHSRGHLALYDSSSRTAVIADAVLWNTLTTRDGQPAFPPTYRYVETYLATIQRLQHMEIETLLTSHFPVARGGEVAEFLGESRAYVERVEHELRRVLKATRAPVTLRALTQQLGPSLGNWPTGAEIYLDFPLLGHLERLVAVGLVAPQREQGRLAYCWSGN